MADNHLTLGSLFDGSGGFPLAGILSGIEPEWASEIEPFCVRVTEKRLPCIKHYGNVSALSGTELEPVDIITFGSPCQDMSLAGKREGLDGKRSGLFFEAVRIIKEMREATHGEYPKYAVWENVPGAFSSNHGEDFRAVLSELAHVKDKTADVPQPSKRNQCGLIMGNGFSVAWRLLDAQYWGVPQRRKRIYLVADFDDERAGEILFESEGLSGYSASRFKAWQRAAGSIENGSGETGGRHCLNTQGRSGVSITSEKTDALIAQDHGNHPAVMQKAVYENHSSDARYAGPLETAPTLTSWLGTGGNNQPLVINTPKTMRIRCGCEGGGKGPLIQNDKSGTLATNNDQTLFEAKPFGISADTSKAMLSDNPRSGIYEADTSRTLDGNGGNPSCNQGGIAVISRSASPVYTSSKASFFTKAHEGTADTLVATDYKDPPLVNEEEYLVRRLTPVECARLQGFPDWWCDDLADENPSDDEVDKWMEIFETNRKALGKNTRPRTRNEVVKWLKHPYTDSAAYRMWGNGICLSNAWFVLAGIAWAEEKTGNETLS